MVTIPFHGYTQICLDTTYIIAQFHLFFHCI